MKVMKILGVVFGALLLLTGIGLLAGSAVVGAGQGEFDKQLAQQGLAGPVQGTVTSIEGSTFTVDYTDKQGTAHTGSGPVADGTDAPSVGEQVNIYYSTADPSRILILNFPGGGDFTAIAGALRTAAIVCLILGALLLLAGIIGLITGKKPPAAVTAGPVGYPAGAPQPGPPGGYPEPGPTPPPGSPQQYPPQPYPPQSQPQQYPPQQYPPQQYPPQSQPPQQYPPQQYPPQSQPPQQDPPQQ